MCEEQDCVEDIREYIEEMDEGTLANYEVIALINNRLDAYYENVDEHNKKV